MAELLSYYMSMGVLHQLATGYDDGVAGQSALDTLPPLIPDVSDHQVVFLDDFVGDANYAKVGRVVSKPATIRSAMVPWSTVFPMTTKLLPLVAVRPQRCPFVAFRTSAACAMEF